MVRWITFDGTTTSEIRSRVPLAAVFEAPGRSALEYALSSSGSVVAVLDVRIENRHAVALFRRVPAQNANPLKPRQIRASGFLGLGDEAVFEEEENPKPKSWWRRLWED
jgi:hypothetical protein